MATKGTDPNVRVTPSAQSGLPGEGGEHPAVQEGSGPMGPGGTQRTVTTGVDTRQAERVRRGSAGAFEQLQPTHTPESPASKGTWKQFKADYFSWTFAGVGSSIVAWFKSFSKTTPPPEEFDTYMDPLVHDSSPTPAAQPISPRLNVQETDNQQVRQLKETLVADAESLKGVNAQFAPGAIESESNKNFSTRSAKRTLDEQKQALLSSSKPETKALANSSGTTNVGSEINGLLQAVNTRQGELTAKSEDLGRQTETLSRENSVLQGTEDRETGRANERLKVIEQRTSQIALELGAVEKRLPVINARLAKVKEEIETSIGDIKILQGNLEIEIAQEKLLKKLEADLKEAEIQVKGLWITDRSEESNRLRAERDELKTRFEEAKGRLDPVVTQSHLSEEKRLLDDKVGDLSAEKARLEEENNSLPEVRKALQDESSLLATESAELNRKSKELERIQSARAGQLRKLRSEFTSIGSEISALSSVASKLEGAARTFRSAESAAILPPIREYIKNMVLLKVAELGFSQESVKERIAGQRDDLLQEIIGKRRQEGGLVKIMPYIDIDSYKTEIGEALDEAISELE